MSDKVTVNLAPSLCSMLTVLFVALKLTGYIAWSWWWVVSPLWIPLAVVFGVIGAGLVVVLVVWAVAVVAALLDAWLGKHGPT